MQYCEQTDTTTLCYFLQMCPLYYTSAYFSGPASQKYMITQRLILMFWEKKRTYLMIVHLSVFPFLVHLWWADYMVSVTVLYKQCLWLVFSHRIMTYCPLYSAYRWESLVLMVMYVGYIIIMKWVLPHSTDVL